MKLISIIIPCYNVEKYIRKCLISLNIQTSKEFEVILIDDNSVDKTLKIVNHLKSTLNFPIHIFKNSKNLGAGETRNIGLRICESKYFMFLDSDDYLEKSCIEKLVSILAKREWDCVCFDYFINKKYMQTVCHTVRSKKQVLSTKEVLVYSNGSACGKVFKTAIVKKNQLKFPSISIDEDLVFIKTVMSYCSKIIYVNRPLYHYVMHSNSLIHSEHSLDNKIPIKAYRMMQKDINKNYQNTLEVLFANEVVYPSVSAFLLQEKGKKEFYRYIYNLERYNPHWNGYIGNGFYCFRLEIILKLIKNRNWFVLRIIIFLQKLAKIFLR